MALKRSTQPVAPPNFPIVEPQKNIEDFSAIDASESSVVINDVEDQKSAFADLVDSVSQSLKDKSADVGMTSQPADVYKGPNPGIQITPSADQKAYKGQLSPRDREDLIKRLNARTATAEDMANIDESMILDLPFIKAADFSIPGQYSPIPKDPAIRFRWVNCVNALQSNMQRYIALGFEMASRDDVDEEKTPLAESMINGTQIKQYDVVLMKINVLQLMALYKKNVLDSLWKLDAVSKGDMALGAAQQTFTDAIAGNRADRVGYNATKAAIGRDPVIFSRT